MIQQYQDASFPCVAVTTCEEERLQQLIVEESEAKCKILSISATGGLRDVRTGAVIDDKADYRKAFSWVGKAEWQLLLVYDFQHVIRNAGAYRSLKDQFPAVKAQTGSMIVLVAPSWSLPLELEHDLPVLELPLPTREQLQAALRTACEGLELKNGKVSDILDAAAGLSLQEAENTFALASLSGDIDQGIVTREKMRLIKSSGYLEVFPAVDPRAIGGLDNYKMYMLDHVLPNKNDSDLAVRGIIFVGVPGTGKSLCSKAAGALLGWPVLRVDVGALKGSLVGQSEANMRGMLKLASAVAPCILWLDEIEKGIGGYASSAATDSGVTLGMVGTLLTWLQEHTSPILTVATCNDYRKLPPELTRAGRIDERFFVDLPSQIEREEIARVHLERLKCDASFSSVIAATTDDFTGAEIEQLVKSAARRTQRKITTESLKDACGSVKPIARVSPEETEALRKWGRECLTLANSPDQPQATGRKVKR